jgi:Holliday junction resolvase
MTTNEIVITATECSMTHQTRLYVEVDGIEYKTRYLNDEDAEALAATLRDCADALVRGAKS